MSEEVVDVLPEDTAGAVEPENVVDDALEAESQTAEQKEAQPEQPKKNGVQKRINELVREREDWKRQAQFFAEQARARESQPEPQETAPELPKVDNYDNYEEYIEALTDYKTQQAIRKQQAALLEQQKAAKQQQAQQDYTTSVQAKLMQGRDKYEDFDAVALSVPMNDEMVAAIADSDVGHDIAYYLGQNPEEAQKIAQMSPVGAVRAMGRLEVKLETAQQTERSKAPAPINPVNKGAKAVVDPNSLSIDEWMAWRYKNLA